jgi:hypothetical protein
VHVRVHAAPQVDKNWRDSRDALSKYGYFNPTLT